MEFSTTWLALIFHPTEVLLCCFWQERNIRSSNDSESLTMLTMDIVASKVYKGETGSEDTKHASAIGRTGKNL